MYHIGPWYYLLTAEGGTEYGHMVVCARSKSVWGPFESHPNNPVLTNRDQAPAIIQGIGHGELIQSFDGSWHILTLGFRQIHLWQPYHTLGREVFLAPVYFNADGWFSAGSGGIRHTAAVCPLISGCGRLMIRADSMQYRFFILSDGREIPLGQGAAKYLSSEVSGGFTGVMLGLYAIGNAEADFENLHIVYS